MTLQVTRLLSVLLGRLYESGLDVQQSTKISTAKILCVDDLFEADLSAILTALIGPDYVAGVLLC